MRSREGICQPSEYRGKDVENRKKIIVYGLGSDFEDLRNIIEKEYSIQGYADSDKEKSKKYSPFLTIEDIREKKIDILITSVKFYGEIRERLISEGIDENFIIGGIKRFFEEPVLVVWMAGGTGNTMLQYAFATALQEYHPETPVYLDVSWYDIWNNGRFRTPSFIYEKLFDAPLQVADADTVVIAKKQGYIAQAESSVYDERYLEIERGYLWGYWFSGKYFSRVKDRLRKAFTFNEALMSPEQKEMLDRIRASESVAVWIRRGDYMEETVARSVGNICTEEYYRKAIGYIKGKYDNAEFFVFSNDSVYIAERYSEYNLMFYDNNNSDIKDYDMYLMSACRHMILANSSFSWWAAQLHGDSGTIISPAKWRHDQKHQDVWEDHWIRM